MDKDRVLDYAIERINEYDGLDKAKKFYSSETDELSDCWGCTLVDYACEKCPFNRYGAPAYDSGCRSLASPTVGQHQKSLIRSTKKWCKEYYPKYTIVRV